MLLLVIAGKEAEWGKFVCIINKSVTDARPTMALHLCYATEFYEWIINFSKVDANFDQVIYVYGNWSMSEISTICAE